MIDSHCHLNADDYLADVDDVIARALDAGVHGMLVPGIGLASCERALEIAAKHECVRVAVGIHPHEAASWNDDAERAIREWAKQPEVVAIGEIGLDFYRDWCPFDLQRRAYVEQLRLARELDLPVVIHDRNAHDEVLAGLEREEVRGVTGVLHCFSGGPQEAERAVALGYFLSFTGSITYGKGKADRVIAKVPLERLLLETDAPYMTPVPHRGERNEPAHVVHVAAALADKRQRSVEEVVATTNEAARALFGFPLETV